MKQHEAVIQVMRQSGGFSTLAHLYREVLQVPGCKWNTKTPFASIRRIVQDERFFFRIRPGLWALKEYRAIVEAALGLNEKEEARASSDHVYYQGLIVDIGNVLKYSTYVPPQDQNKRYLAGSLGEQISLRQLPGFTYESVVQRVKTVDVIWLNNRGYPTRLYEVEHTTDMQNSLLKFAEMVDFACEFRIVSMAERSDEFRSRVDRPVFAPIRQRVKFVSYDTVAELHAKVAGQGMTISDL